MKYSIIILICLSAFRIKAQELEVFSSSRFQQDRLSYVSSPYRYAREGIIFRHEIYDPKYDKNYAIYGVDDLKNANSPYPGVQNSPLLYDYLHIYKKDHEGNCIDSIKVEDFFSAKKFVDALIDHQQATVLVCIQNSPAFLNGGRSYDKRFKRYTYLKKKGKWYLKAVDRFNLASNIYSSGRLITAKIVSHNQISLYFSKKTKDGIISNTTRLGYPEKEDLQIKYNFVLDKVVIDKNLSKDVKDLHEYFTKKYGNNVVYSQPYGKIIPYVDGISSLDDIDKEKSSDLYKRIKVNEFRYAMNIEDGFSENKEELTSITEEQKKEFAKRYKKEQQIHEEVTRKRK